MDKINGFKITNVTMSGFSCFKADQSFGMDDLTYISGGNHVGKTSIANAIVFAVTGTTFQGEAKMLDKLYNEDVPEIEVRLKIKDNVGKNHELVRKRKNDKMAITFDGYSVRQADLNELFGERDVFLSIFNPIYFIEILGDEGKSLLERHLPFVAHETALAALSEYQQTLLEGESLLSPDVYVTQKREEIRSHEAEIVACNGQKTLLADQRRENAQKLKNLQTSIMELSAKIKLLSDKKLDGIDEKAINAELTALSLRYDELLADKPTLDTTEIDSKLQTISIEIEKIKVAVYESKYIGELAKMQAELDSAKKEHGKTTAVMGSVRAGMTCPQCLRGIDENNIEDVKVGFTKRMKEIVVIGKDLQTQLREVLSLDTKAKEVFTQFQSDDAAKKQAELEALRAEKAKLTKDFQTENTLYDDKLQDVQSQMQSINEQLLMGGLSIDETQELQGLEPELMKKKTEFLAIKSVYKQEHLAGLEEKIKLAEEQITQKNQLVYAAVEYAAKRAELTFGNLITQNVKIVLYKVLKTTSEVKNCFQFTYKDRDYKRLSRSEKLLAGVETVELLKKLTGRSYPIFIDDAESIENIPKPSGQVLLAIVRSKTPLTVTASSNKPPLNKAA